MSFTATLVGFLAGLTLAIYGMYKSRKEYVPGALPLIPPGALMFIGVLIAILMLGHFITLFTGVDFKGRRG